MFYTQYTDHDITCMRTPLYNIFAWCAGIASKSISGWHHYNWHYTACRSIMIDDICRYTNPNNILVFGLTKWKILIADDDSFGTTNRHVKQTLPFLVLQAQETDDMQWSRCTNLYMDNLGSSGAVMNVSVPQLRELWVSRMKMYCQTQFHGFPVYIYYHSWQARSVHGAKNCWKHVSAPNKSGWYLTKIIRCFREILATMVNPIACYHSLIYSGYPGEWLWLPNCRGALVGVEALVEV